MIFDSDGRPERWIGTALLSCALGLSAYNVWEAEKERASSEAAMRKISEFRAGEQSFEQTPDYILNPQMEMPVVQIDGLDYVSSLEIPKLNLTLPVLSEYVFENLKIAPCRYSGSAYLDDLVICAHNSGSHFGELKNMAPEDTLRLTDMDGNVFSYIVREVTVIAPDQVEEFTQSGYALTLFTCTISGADRVVVRCEKKETDGLKSIRTGG